MVPFDGTATAQQPPQSHGGMSRQAMTHGHQGTPSPVMPHQHHQQSMNSFGHPGVHRQPSAGMGGAPNFSIPQSPGSRQNSFGGMTGYQGHSQSTHHPMHSPAHQQHQNFHHGQMHPSAQQSHQHQSHPQHMGMGTGPTQHPNMGSGGMDNRQRGGQYVPVGMNGNWQSDRDMPKRREMIQHM